MYWSQGYRDWPPRSPMAHCSMTFICVISPLLCLLYYLSMITLPSITILQQVVNKPQSEVLYITAIYESLGTKCPMHYRHVHDMSSWVFITTCWSRQYGFNLVRPRFEPGTPTTIRTDALDRSANDPAVQSFIWDKFGTWRYKKRVKAWAISNKNEEQN